MGLLDKAERIEQKGERKIGKSIVHKKRGVKSKKRPIKSVVKSLQKSVGSVAKKSKKKSTNNKVDKTTEIDNIPRVKSHHHETVIDQIYEFIQTKGSISINEISLKFRLPETQIEELINILDKARLIDIYYPVAGKISVRKKGFAGGIKKVQNPKLQKIINMAVFAVLTFVFIILVVKAFGII